MYFKALFLFSLVPIIIAADNPSLHTSMGAGAGNMAKRPRSVSFNQMSHSSMGAGAGNMNAPRSISSKPQEHYGAGDTYTSRKQTVYGNTVANVLPRSTGDQSGVRSPCCLSPASIVCRQWSSAPECAQAREGKAKRDIFADKLIARYSNAETDENELFAY